MRPSYLLFVVIPLLNIALNTFSKKTAMMKGSYLSAIFSMSFLITFAIGTCSVLSLVMLYRDEVPLYRGILLMGAISIVAGSTWAALSAGVWPAIDEFVLLITIVALIGYRFIRAAN